VPPRNPFRLLPAVNPLWDRLFGRHEGSAAPFLHLADGGTITYSDFLGLAARYAHLLTEHGLRPRDRLAVQTAKSPETLALYAACVQTGIVFLPLNTAYTPAEMDYFVSDSGCALVVGDPAADQLPGIARHYGAKYLTLAADGTGTLADISAGPRTYPTNPRAEIDLAALLYTSGTTGRSKGAMLTQRNLLSNALTLAELWRFTSDDVLLHALPVFHTHGLFVATNVTLAAGGSMIFMPKFDVDAVVDHLPRATSMMGVPTFYTRLLADERFDADRCRNIRLLISGSAPMLEDTHRRVEARTGHRVLERYGMTETGMICSNPCDGDRRIGTVGPPLPGVSVRIVAEGTEVPPGETGVLHVKGPNVFQGYWGRPRKTREELSPDGWFRTGDLALMDEHGYVTIVGREKDLIISGGYNVYPREIEQLLDEMPGVLESCVIGAPHPDLGETVIALLVPDDEGPDIVAIEAALKDRLAGYKRPRIIETVSELPRNTMGKVQKAELRQRYADRFA
jgi:malonyl-CoA/methylmalonyl-CoA synthetase